MASSSGVLPWSLTMPAGSLQQWLFTFTTPDTSTGTNIPYPITGATWEYVVRTSATDTGTPLVDITTTTSAAGLITVTATASLSQVELTINPAATASLVPQAYFQALWMNPSTASAFAWVTGELIIQGTPQP